MRIVFFGTPEFAAASLRALLTAGMSVAGVVTQPDRPQGRSRSSLVPPPVKTVALEAGLPVLQPERPTGEAFLAELAALQPEIGVVVAYGHILRPAVLETPPRGMLNVHASLLPRLRGAAPIQWAIANGDEETGVCIMRMEAGLDSGPVLAYRATPIGAGETGGALTARLAGLGAELLVETLGAVARGAVREVPQNHAGATYAPKISRETARVDWQQPAAVVARRIRAFDPAPGAWATLGGAEMKLFGASDDSTAASSAEPGTVIAAGDTLRVATGAGAVELREVQPAGKRRLAVAEWTRGRGAAAGDRFG